MKKNSKKLTTALLPLFAILFFLGVPMQATAEGNYNFSNLILLVNFEDSSADGYGVADVFNDGYTNSSITYCWKKIPSGAYLTSTFSSYYNDDDMNFTQYLYDISDGALRVNNYVPQENSDGSVATLTLPGSANDYVNDETNFVHTVVSALLGDNPTIPVDVSQLDYNNDGYVDNLTILVQGPNTGAFYAHKTNYLYYEDTVHGKHFSAYNIISVPALINQNYGVLAHEFLHSLGAPDLYRTSGPEGDPVGIWDIMAQAIGSFLQYPLSYTRASLGWLTIPEITESGDYTLNCTTSASGNRAFSIKTALSETELFVVEYRRQGQSLPISEYDCKIPESGLIVYRVDNTVEEKSNTLGNNYIYVFRPNTSSNPALANETYIDSYNIKRNEYTRAAVGTAARPTLGNSDLTKSCTENTIFYADGSNSGIVISNVTFSPDGKTASFHVELPQLSDDNYWAKYGSSIPMSSFNSVSLAKDESSQKLYAAYHSGEYYPLSLKVVAYNEAAGVWEQLGNDFTQGNAMEKPILSYTGGSLRLLYTGSDEKPHYTVWNGSNWIADTIIPFSLPNNLQFVAGSTESYISFNLDNHFYIWNPTTNTQIAELTVSNGFAHPKAVYYQSEFYVLYADYPYLSEPPNPDKTAKFAKYNASSGWSTLYTATTVNTARTNDLCVSDDILYAAINDNNGVTSLISYDGNSWQEEIISNITGSIDPILNVKSGIPYVTWASHKTIKVHYRQNNSWKQLSENVCTDAEYIDAVTMGNHIYVGASSSLFLTVRRYATATDSFVVTLTPPAGYSDSILYIDGVEYTAQDNNGQKTVTLSSGTAQTAIMYLYNQNQVPIGMYVWQLTYTDHHYTATPIPELENLISYHGFSVRFQGYTGIRFKSGLDSSTKSELLSSAGLNGYHMVECGTLVMLQSNRGSNPFIKGNAKVAQGRAYYTENGSTYNAVLERVAGRERYASVLTKLPVNRYKAEYAFRGYATIAYNGRELIVYGPPVSKSMYNIAVQLLNSGSYTPGSDPYNFLQKIITDADNQ